MVFQDGLLFPHLTVEGNLRYGQTGGVIGRAVRKRERAIEFPRVIETLEIGGLLQRYPRNLSGGEKQRVALGRALLSGPELLLMDEPLASLDAPLSTRILAYLERVVAQWDIPTLFVTHSQVEVRRAARVGGGLGEGAARSGPACPKMPWASPNRWDGAMPPVP